MHMSITHQLGWLLYISECWLLRLSNQEDLNEPALYRTVGRWSSRIWEWLMHQSKISLRLHPLQLFEMLKTNDNPMMSSASGTWFRVTGYYTHPDSSKLIPSEFPVRFHFYDCQGVTSHLIHSIHSWLSHYGPESENTGESLGSERELSE